MRLVTRTTAIFLALAVHAALGGCATGSYLWYKIAPDYPEDQSDTIDIPGLLAPVRVYLDEAGISHIDAQNDEDLLRATGFTQARSRFFEMDMFRRFARGRLSELVGEQKVPTGSTVEVDLSMRGWGIDKASVDDVKALAPGTRKLLDAYTAGINHGMKLYEPLEYRLLRVDPEPWTVEDCFAVGRLNAWSVTHNWHQELSRVILALHLGLDRAEKIYSNDWWHGGTSIPAKDAGVALPPAIHEALKGVFPGRACPAPGEKKPATHAGAALLAVGLSSASNSWVVSGELSASGRPIVAGDPHMAHLLPSIVLQQHLRAPGIDVIGVTVAGLPWILAGHNRNVAWSMTSLVGDAVDLYVERQNPKDPGEYETPAGMRKFEKEEVVIGRRDGSAMAEKRYTIRRSAHGVLVNDMYPGLLPAWAPPIALKWDTTGTAASIDALSRANRAKNVDELHAALAAITTPATTWSAADDKGTIAVFATGSHPVRKGHLGTFPAPGWNGCCEWDGKVDPVALPGATSTTGFFAHANNLMVDPSKSKVFVNVDSAPSYRFDRIVELLGATKKHTWQTMSAIQQDVKLNRAARLVPLMLADLKKATLTAQESAALAVLEKWDFNAGVDSAAAAIFFSTYRFSIIGALEDEVDPRGFEFVLAQRYSTNVADLWFDAPEHVVWDNRCTPAKEGRREAVTAAFKRAVAAIAGAQGADPAKWRWGALHDLQQKHLFGGQKALADLVNLPTTEAAGGLDSVWKSHFDLAHPTAPFRAMAGPVYRHVIDLADLDHGHWIIDTGTSGWPSSPHYGDQAERWRRGELIPMLYSWDEIKAQAKAVLELVP